MKFHGVYAFILCLSIVFSTGLSAASESGDADKTLSPYFWVKSDDPGVDSLPLKSTAVAADIAGVIADVRVTQVYENQGTRPLEAIYVFPASTRAAVYGMKMTIGERTITAKIEERQKARQDYEQARQEGKSASLLEQQRPNVFQMNIANIMPKDVIKVELSYTELLVPEEGVYEFVYPTVVGPRYSNLKEEGSPSSENWVQNPYLRQGEPPAYTFDMTARISTGIPIEEVTCPSHKTNVQFEGPSLAVVRLDPLEKHGGNRDVAVKYRLAGQKIETGLLLYEGEKENFFLLMMQPPKRVSPEQIPRREYIFIVDVSGSMRGFPLEVSKTLLKNLITGLQTGDRFNVLLFSGGSTLLSEQSLDATPENISRAVQLIDNQRGGGGTELLPALERSLALPGDKSGSRTLVIVTDGYVRVEKEAFDLIRTRLGEANMFPFGIGSSVNRFLIEGMARAGMGEPFVILKPDEAAQKAEKFRRYIATPVLTSVDLKFSGFKAFDVEPPAVPDVLAERPVIVFGKWQDGLKGTIRMTGYAGKHPYSEELKADQFKPDPVNAGLRYLWARHRIAMLSDYNAVSQDPDTVREITRLGLDYNLLTAYTSFIAIDNQVRNKGGESTTVKQPLPLPQGVEDSAVGGPPALRSPSPQMSMGMGLMKEMAPRMQIQSDTSAEKKEALPLKVHVASIEPRMVISGEMSRSYLQTAIQNHLKEIEACLQTAAEQGHLFRHGNASLKLVINGEGEVTSAEFGFTGPKAADLEKCIQEKVKTWRFSKSKDGKSVSVEYVLAIQLKA